MSKVLDLNPIGYWPADEGEGDKLHDITKNGNHAKVLRVPWENGLLNFTGLYQWAEIPDHPNYKAKTFSIGGWVFVREKVVGGLWPGWAGMTFIGNSNETSGYTLDTLYDSNVLFNKSKWWVFGKMEEGVSICLRKEEKVDVVSGGKPDAIGSCANTDIKINLGEWHHIIYTYEAGAPIEGGSNWIGMEEHERYYEAGVGKLYINGQLAQEKCPVKYKPRNMRFMIGNDAVWWLQSINSGSLNGAISNLIMFDRVLEQTEVVQLYEISKPQLIPSAYSYNSCSSLSVSDKIEEIRMILKDGTDEKVKAELLNKYVQMLKNKEITKEEQIEAILAVSLFGGAAKKVVPVILKLLETTNFESTTIASTTLKTTTIEGRNKEKPPHFPRIEEFYRNVVIKALLNIDPHNEQARKLLNNIYAKPIIDLMDLSMPCYKEVCIMVENGLYMDAIELFTSINETIPTKEPRNSIITQGDWNWDNRGSSGNEKAYTATSFYNGYTYILGNGKSFDGIESVTEEDFEKSVSELASAYPEAKTWRKPDDKNLYRVKIIKRDSQGNEQTTYLQGKNFIFDGSDAKLKGWSISLDAKGYIHIVGGMHNAPVSDNYIPGSWDSIGASKDFTDDNYPSMFYWVSKKPEDIESLEFLGQRCNPRNIPVPFGLNYMNFMKDRNGVLYLYGRIFVQGIQSWGLYRYDINTCTWEGIGSFAPDVKKEFPEWSNEIIEMACDWVALPSMRLRNTHPKNKVLVWARQPHFYNFMRGWGMQFDLANRLHVQVPIFGIDEDNRNVNTELYAYSDDFGKTFYRADGVELELPLTVNPGKGNASMLLNDTELRWNTWISILEYAGYGEKWDKW